jgi:hypothetical protein
MRSGTADRATGAGAPREGAPARATPVARIAHSRSGSVADRRAVSAGWRVATGAVDLTALGTAGSDAVVLLLLDTQHYGVLVAQIFFGLWLVPLGYLAHKSGWFPTALCVLLVAAGASYIVDLLAAFLVPGFAQTIHLFIIPVVAVAEIWMVLYLLVIGVRTGKPVERLPAVG